MIVHFSPRVVEGEGCPNSVSRRRPGAYDAGVEPTQIVMLIATAVGSIALGVVAVLLRRRKTLPAVVRYLPFVVAVLAPVAGILGTVIGLQVAFGATAEADPSQKAARLAEGISAAMSWTAMAIVFSVTFIAAVVAAELATRTKSRPSPDASAG